VTRLSRRPRTRAKRRDSNCSTRVGNNLLKLGPEGADVAGYRHRCKSSLSLSAQRSLGSRGQQQLASQLRTDLQRVNAFNTSPLSFANANELRGVFAALTRKAIEGFGPSITAMFPVGGWAQYALRRHSELSAPISTFRDFSTANHPIENSADADAYLARLQSYPKQLGRRTRPHAGCSALPASYRLRFLIEPKALAQIGLSAKAAKDGGSLVEIDRAGRTKTKKHSGRLGRTCAKRSQSRKVAPALDRQLQELQVQKSDGNERRGHVGAAQGR